VGEENRGFYMLIPALAIERLSMAPHILGAGRRLIDMLVHYCRETYHKGQPLSANPVIRNKLAERAIELETLRTFGLEIMWKMSTGKMPGYEAARNKLYSNLVTENLAKTGLEIIGAYSQISPDSKWAKLKGRLQNLYLLNAGWFSAAGTIEIQKNVIGQFKLGLPRPY